MMKLTPYEIAVSYLIYKDKKYSDFMELSVCFGNDIARNLIVLFSGRSIDIPTVEDFEVSLLNIRLWYEVKKVGFMNLKSVADKNDVTEDYLQGIYKEVDYLVQALMVKDNIQYKDIEKEEIVWKGIQREI